MSNHHNPSDEAPPAPSRFKAAAEFRRQRYLELVAEGVDHEGIRQRLQITTEQLRQLARATGVYATRERGSGDVRDAKAPPGYTWRRKRTPPM